MCAGTNGFSTSLNCVKTLTIEINIMKQIELEKGIRYLKTSYGLHCANNTTVASHCISCVLFHPEDNDYQSSTCETHPDKCQDGRDLLICMNQIKTLVNQLQIVKKYLNYLITLKGK